jgi:tripartite-type tricarboxylate transporter receptor subunit TctC
MTARKIMLGRTLLAGAMAFALSVRAQEQDYPGSPIKIVVPAAPGATTDTLARIIADQLQRKWGQPAIVDNRAGAAGNIGAEYAIKANPDGYTLLFSYPAPLVVNKSLYPKLVHDPDAFGPVSLVGTAPLVLAMHPNGVANSVQQLIAFARANPNRLNYASQGNGTTGHLAAEMFKSLAGVMIVHVPYRSSAPAQTALLSGQVDMMFVELSSVLPQLSASKLRPLAVGGERRSPLLPGIPAMSEVLPGFVALTWFGMVAPPGTPAAIVNKLSAAIAQTLQQPDVAKRLLGMSVDAIGSTPAEMALFLRQERERWGKVIRATGATAE